MQELASIAQELYNYWVTELQNNQVLVAFVGGSLFAALLFLVRTVPYSIYRFCKRRVLVDLVIDSRSYKLFEGVEVELGKNKALKNTHTLRIVQQWEGTTDEEEGKHVLADSIGYGTHFAVFGKVPCLVRFERDREGHMGTNFLETFTFTTFRFLRGSLLKKIRSCSRTEKDEEYIKVCRYHSTRGWLRGIRKPLRSLDTICYTEKQEIVDDAVRFFSAKGLYAEKGIPHRRGHLFHGDPGTGKTSMTHALASTLGKDVFVLTLSTLNDDKLLDAVQEIPTSAIVLLEDVDAVGMNREDTKKEKDGITLSGLLNSIDGLSASEGRLLIMTTNHRDRLDPALIRPGRVDKEFLFKELTSEEIYGFYGKDLPEGKTGAELQELVLKDLL